METILELILDADTHAVAITAPHGTSLTLAGLHAAIDRLAGQLRSLGMGRGDRVAIVLPNGQEMALVFLAASSCWAWATSPGG
ncbi:MAG: AMP-binding protein [Gemmatimonadales bacterium]|nr:AMP-binding protein [Gemmatimonadales bacterium]NIN12408.1 AMP-binding protein [Gemmatimonadales bacterium]NIR00777.1 AMP-binding protein [Gemmatimonadales bacterium]